MTQPGRSAAGGAPLPRQAMVLAAGEGIRMRPLTDDRAKPTLPLMNRPLLLHVLDFLARRGIERAVVNLHHRPDTMRAILDGPMPGGLEVTISLEPVILGTGGGIAAALRHLDREAPLLVANADSLCDADLGALAAVHADAVARHHAPATLAVKGRGPGETYSPVHLDPEGRIAGIGDVGGRGDPVTFIGLHLLAPEAVARLPQGVPSEIVRDVYQPYLREGRRLGAFRHDGWWIETGTPSLYLRSHLRLLRETAFLDGLPRECGSRGAGALPSWIGAQCEGLGAARVEASVLGPGCRIGAGASVSRSILAAGARVGPGARVEDSILWEGIEVPDGAKVSGRLLIREGRGAPAREVPLP